MTDTIKPVAWMFKGAESDAYSVTISEAFAREFDAPDRPVIPLFAGSSLDRAVLEIALRSIRGGATLHTETMRAIAHLTALLGLTQEK